MSACICVCLNERSSCCDQGLVLTCYEACPFCCPVGVPKGHEKPEQTPHIVYTFLIFTRPHSLKAFQSQTRMRGLLLSGRGLMQEEDHAGHGHGNREVCTIVLVSSSGCVASPSEEGGRERVCCVMEGFGLPACLFTPIPPCPPYSIVCACIFIHIRSSSIVCLCVCVGSDGCVLDWTRTNWYSNPKTQHTHTLQHSTHTTTTTHTSNM